MTSKIRWRAIGAIVALGLAGSLLPLAPAQGAHAAVVTEDIRVAMTDGTELAVRIVRPDDSSEQHPVLLTFSPYGQTRDVRGGVTYYSKTYDFVRVAVDVRGTGASAGAFCLLCPREQEDAHDILEWAAGTGPIVASGRAAAPSWSNGQVAVAGGSYAAILGLLAAARQPEGLRTVVARSAASDLYRDATWHNGMLSQVFVAQWAAYQNSTSARGPSGTETNDVSSLPHRIAERTANEKVFDKVLENPYDNEVYRSRSPYDVLEQIDIPTLLVDGWQDGFSKGAIRNLQGLPNARLLMGPYGHHHGGDWRTEPQADPRAPAPLADRPVENYSETIRYPVEDGWIEQHLTGSHAITDGISMEKGFPSPCDIDDDWKICYFDRGAATWKHGSAWPLAGGEVERLWLTSSGAGSGASPAEGTLSQGRPPGDTPPHSFVYDPTIGVTETFSKWGQIGSAPLINLDQRPDANRTLSYITPALEEPLELAGPMELRFFAATTAKDTDWVVKVSRVADGATRLITSGYLRASQRKWDEEKSLPAAPWITNLEQDVTAPNECAEAPETGCINEYRIDIWDIAWTIQPGERLLIAISSGDTPSHTPSPWAAVNTIYHGEKYPSSLFVTTAGEQDEFDEDDSDEDDSEDDDSAHGDPEEDDSEEDGSEEDDSEEDDSDDDDDD